MVMVIVAQEVKASVTQPRQRLTEETTKANIPKAMCMVWRVFLFFLPAIKTRPISKLKPAKTVAITPEIISKVWVAHSFDTVAWSMVGERDCAQKVTLGNPLLPNFNQLERSVKEEEITFIKLVVLNATKQMCDKNTKGIPRYKETTKTLSAQMYMYL